MGNLRDWTIGRSELVAEHHAETPVGTFDRTADITSVDIEVVTQEAPEEVDPKRPVVITEGRAETSDAIAIPLRETLVVRKPAAAEGRVEVTPADTQTGLRGIPAGLIPRVASIPGDRYEYEMAMLADAKNHEEKPLQIPIETIYIEENATSHFNPILDTIRVYRSLIQFCFSSVLSFLIDNGVFAAAMAVMAPKSTLRRYDILIALVLARVISSHFNYLYNRFVVFPRKGRRHHIHRSYYGYIGLVIVMMVASYFLTEGASAVLDVKGVWITIVKIVAETILFVASYFIQKKFIFKSRR